MINVLILNCYSRNSLTVINSLDKNYRLFGADKKVKREKYIDWCFKSPRLTEIIRYNSPTEDPKKCLGDIIQACKKFNIDILIPTGTDMTNYISEHKHTIEDQVKVTIMAEDYNKLLQVTDKWLAHRLFQKAKVKTPKTILLDINHLSKAQSLQYPVLLKPRISFASIGIKFFNSFEELKADILDNPQLYERCVSASSPFILQEKIEGELHDATILAKDGHIVALMTQQRHVTLYDFGGGGIINRTTTNEVCCQHATNFISYIKWNGMGLLDFIKDKEGNYFLLEFNPKIWGTSYLTTAAGLNMVQIMVELFLFNKDIKPFKQYEENLLYKWLIPECIFYIFHKPFSLVRFLHRFKKVWTNYGAERMIHNINKSDMRHLLGIIFNKSM